MKSTKQNKILENISKEDILIYKIIKAKFNNIGIESIPELITLTLETKLKNKERFKISDYYNMVNYVNLFFCFKFKERYYEVKDGGLIEIDNERFIDWFRNLCNC